jgi:hypothetical protein
LDVALPFAFVPFRRLHFGILIRSGLRHEMEMRAWAWLYASFISPNSLFLWRRIEQWQLQDVCYAAFAVYGGTIRRFPVEQPLTRAEVDQGQLRGAKGRLLQAGILDRLQVLVIVLQFDAVGGESHSLVLHASANRHTPRP